jgi:hypothetical protein
VIDEDSENSSEELLKDPLGVEIDVFCQAWEDESYDRKNAKSRERYIVNELKRLVTDKIPVISSILRAHPNCQVQTMELLSKGFSVNTAQIPIITQAFLQLVEPDRLKGYKHRNKLGKLVDLQCLPPNIDPQGRVIDAEKQGKVLVVKVGTRGGLANPNEEDPDANVPFSSEQIQRKQDIGKSIYNMVSVTRTPQSFPVRTAVVILRQYGWAIAQNPFRDNGKCNWLVIEHPQNFVGK